MNEEAGQPGKLEFPCLVGIKAFGHSSDDFADLVTTLVATHAGETAIVDVRVRDSRGGNYLSVTCDVYLQSRAQMEAIYLAMHEHPDVLMTL
jgi:putative lipoic acid-binding regulatory protein